MQASTRRRLLIVLATWIGLVLLLSVGTRSTGLGPFLAFVGAIATVAYLMWAFMFRADARGNRGGEKPVEHQGLLSSKKDPFGLLEVPFTLFQWGATPVVENVVWGKWEGMDVIAFDFSVTRVERREETRLRYSCVVTPVPSSWAPLVVRKETIPTALADSMALHDIEFESWEFNQAFEVWSTSPRFANAFVDQLMMQWLLSKGTHWGIEIVDGRLLSYQDKVVELPRRLAAAQELKKRIPPVVYSLFPEIPEAKRASSVPQPGASQRAELMTESLPVAALPIGEYRSTIDKPLRRTAADKMVAGVCGALGRYYGFQPLALRIMFVVLTFSGGLGVLLYLYAWLCIRSIRPGEVVIGLPKDRVSLRRVVRRLALPMGIMIFFVIGFAGAWSDPDSGWQGFVVLAILLNGAALFMIARRLLARY